jgi:hypothetical protein
MEQSKITFEDIKKIIRDTTAPEMESGLDWIQDALGYYYCENGDKRTGVWLYATNGRRNKGIWKNPEVRKELSEISLVKKIEEVSQTDRMVIESFPEYESAYRRMTRKPRETKDVIDPASEVSEVRELGETE